jgi:hypothetical protein
MSIHARRPKVAAQHLRLLSADTTGRLVSNEEPAVTRMRRRFAPGTLAGATPVEQQQPDQTPPSRLRTLSPGPRALIAILVLIAMLPNLALGAIFFFGVINTPWSAPNANPSTPALPRAVLSAPTMLEATAGEEVNLPIALDGTDGVPARSIIAISGLPQGSMLSSGRPYGETEWNLKTDEIGDLHLNLPSNASGDSKLTIKLVGPDGAIITDTGLVLKMNSPARTEAAETRVEKAEELGTTDKGERLTNLDLPTPPGDPVKLPSRRPVPTKSNDVDANWLRPLAFVNLREGPSPSARVVSVVAKGTKLRVIGRKGRWVRVTHSSTSKSGWIYAGNVATVR